MASKTSLPIARLRSLGCRVGTLIGHCPTAPMSPNWRYSITLPAHLRGTLTEDSAVSRHGMARGYYHAVSESSIVEAYVNPSRTLPAEVVRQDRRRAESDVAGFLNAMADVLSKAGR